MQIPVDKCKTPKNIPKLKLKSCSPKTTSCSLNITIFFHKYSDIKYQVQDPSPSIAWMKPNMTTISQLSEPRRTVDELSVGDQESDYDDDDRRELISHYATDKYLSKWELAEDDDEEDQQEKLDNEMPSGESE